MDIEVKIDAAQSEPKVIIITDKLTDKVQGIISALENITEPQVISGFSGDRVRILEQDKIIRIYTEGGKLCADTEEGQFILRGRLYEMEERLDKKRFVRISNSEIINLKKTSGLDLSFTGTICVTMSNGAVTYVSRRYVSKIKKILGV